MQIKPFRHPLQHLLLPHTLLPLRPQFVQRTQIKRHALREIQTRIFPNQIFQFLDGRLHVSGIEEAEGHVVEAFDDEGRFGGEPQGGGGQVFPGGAMTPHGGIRVVESLLIECIAKVFGGVRVFATCKEKETFIDHLTVGSLAYQCHYFSGCTDQCRRAGGRMVPLLA